MQFPVIDTDIPYAEYPPTFEDLQARIAAAFNSLAEIADDVQVTDSDIGVSACRRLSSSGIQPDSSTTKLIHAPAPV